MAAGTAYRSAIAAAYNILNKGKLKIKKNIYPK